MIRHPSAISKPKQDSVTRTASGKMDGGSSRPDLSAGGRHMPTDSTAPPPDDPALLAQAEEYLKADQWYCEGKFDAYRGEYVFFSNGIIFGHGRNLADLRPIAEEKAAALGIPPER